MSTLSVIIIARNEAADIRYCLESVKWANEVIVFDSGSTDGTPNICREYTDKVFETDWPGYGVQKNRALKQASSEWILSLDADEIVSETLQQEILALINSSTTNHPPHAAYEIPFISHYYGKPIRHGDWGSEFHTRLFKRAAGYFKESPLHEKLLVTGSLGRLNAPIYHHPYQNVDEVLEKLNRYSTDGAKLRLSQQQKSSFTKALARGFWTFFRSYIIRRGFLDGKEGLMLAISGAENTYYRYLKLMYLGLGLDSSLSVADKKKPHPAKREISC
jgi:glycosyltransferase involved in cell wall biosynthesis